MLLTLFYFILALFILVTVHEYGHFLVARICGVKVLRFSFGFGKVLWRKKDKHQTEFVLSAIPLGGYVKMLDEHEGKVCATDKPYAFNNQSLFKRFSIVIAGPLFNFLFAWFAFWLVLLIGKYSLAPIIDTVKPHSVASQAGLIKNQEIIALNHKTIHNWQDFQYQLIPLIGKQEIVPITVKSLDTKIIQTLPLSLAQWQSNKPIDPLDDLGITPFIPKTPPIVGEVIPDSIAQQAGFHVGDKIISVDESLAVDDWLTIVERVKKSPDTTMRFVVLRHGKRITIQVVTGSQGALGNKEGYLGLRSQTVEWPPSIVRFERQNPFQAAITATQQTYSLSLATFKMIGVLVSGTLGLENLSGPIGIAQGAGASGRMGLATYLTFMAFISISLGVLNLLPIPMLDGGHLFYYLIELILRKPLSERIRNFGAFIGVSVITLLMLVALYNDFSRILS